MQPFDPYRKWLGIPVSERSPNHYRILGLAPFETDLDVIEGAAERQINSIRQYQSGEHGREATQLLNELAAARRCLMQPTIEQEETRRAATDNESHGRI